MYSIYISCFSTIALLSVPWCVQFCTPCHLNQLSPELVLMLFCYQQIPLGLRWGSGCSIWKRSEEEIILFLTNAALIFNIAKCIHSVYSVYKSSMNLCLNSGYCSLFGKPFLQIRIPSRTPLQASWCKIRWLSQTPGKMKYTQWSDPHIWLNHKQWK